MHVHPEEVIEFHLLAYPSNTSFIVFQAHTYIEHITLSMTTKPGYGTAVSGRDVGVVTSITDAGQPISWYVISNGTQLAEKFRVMVLASLYNTRGEYYVEICCKITISGLKTSTSKLSN